MKTARAVSGDDRLWPRLGSAKPLGYEAVQITSAVRKDFGDGSFVTLRLATFETPSGQNSSGVRTLPLRCYTREQLTVCKRPVAAHSIVDEEGDYGLERE